MIASFPLEDILASRDNEALQSENSAIIATTRADHAPETRCESCGGSGNALDWFYFESPAYYMGTFVWPSRCHCTLQRGPQPSGVLRDGD